MAKPDQIILTDYRQHSMLPTPLAFVIAINAEIMTLDERHNSLCRDGLIDLQKLSLAGIDFETALTVFKHWIDNKKLSKPQKEALKNIYDLTKDDINGELLQILGNIADDNTGIGKTREQDKIDAVKVIHAITHGEDNLLDTKEVGKLIVNLTQKAS